MKNVDIISKVVGRKGEAMASPSKDAAPVNLSGYLLKEVWDKCWEIRTTDKGEEYIFGKLPVALQYGLTSYVDGKMLDLPSIYDGLVIDNQTIYWEEIKEEVGTDEEGNPIYKTTKVLKAKGGNGENSGGGGVGSVLWSDIEGKPSWLTDNKISYSEIEGTPDLAIFATEDYVKAVITSSIAGLATEQFVLEQIAGLEGGGTIDLSSYAEKTWVSSNFASLGETNIFTKANKFNGGLFVNGKEIKYNSDGYWELEGDLLVTGGITSFASSSGFTPSTIMDGIVCDEQTITVDVINGVKTLKVIGGGSGTIHWDDIEGAPTSLKNPYALVINGTTYDGSKMVEINISGSSNNTQSIYPLIIKDSSGAKQLTYDPSSKQETLALTKSMVGLGNVEDTALSKWNGSDKITTVGTITSGTWQGSEITNDYLAYDYIKIAGQKVSLGESITSATLKTELDIVTLSDEQNINGKKHFNGGLTIGGGEIEYNEDGYWKLTGNLLVTGGITSYASDGKATPFLINVDTWESILSESTTQVYSANAVTLLKNEVQSVGMDADSALAKLAIIAEELSSLTTSSYTADIRTSLMNIATKIK